jgi:NAD+ synthase
MDLQTRIINWLKDYSENNGDLSFVVGVSGGIDSAVVSTLCSLTNIKTHVISIPIKQNEKQLLLANEHISWLTSKFPNVETHTIDLSDLYESLEKQFDGYNTMLGLANTKSRLRMVTLYHLATKFNGLVVGTGNKVEDFGIGFFTKYGDGGVDISPIADLLKSEVKFLAKSLSISDDIIKAKPTDGLWEDDRCDEEQIGASYEELEWAMSFLETPKQLQETEIKKLDDRKLNILNIYKNLNKKNFHKMVSIPLFKK